MMHPLNAPELLPPNLNASPAEANSSVAPAMQHAVPAETDVAGCAELLIGDVSTLPPAVRTTALGQALLGLLAQSGDSAPSAFNNYV